MNQFARSMERRKRAANNENAFNRLTEPISEVDPTEAGLRFTEDAHLTPFRRSMVQREVEDLEQKYDTNADVVKNLIGTEEYKTVQAQQELRDRNIVDEDTDEIEFKHQYQQDGPNGLRVETEDKSTFIPNDDLDSGLRHMYQNAIKRDMKTQFEVTEDIAGIQQEMAHETPLKKLDKHAGPGRKFVAGTKTTFDAIGRGLGTATLGVGQALTGMAHMATDPEAEEPMATMFLPDVDTPGVDVIQGVLPEVQNRDEIKNRLSNFGLSEDKVNQVLNTYQEARNLTDVENYLKGAEDAMLDWMKEPVHNRSGDVLDLLESGRQIAQVGFMDSDPGLSSVEEVIWTGTNALWSLGTATGVTAATGSPDAGAAVLSGVESIPTYREAREAGKSPKEARKIVARKGVGTFALERVGLEYWMGGLGSNAPGVLKNMVWGGLVNSGEEMTQEWWQNLIDKEWNENSKILDNSLRAAVGGFIAGNVGGAINSQIGTTEQDAFLKTWKAKNLPEIVESADENNRTPLSQARVEMLKQKVAETDPQLSSDEINTIAQDVEAEMSNVRFDINNTVSEIPALRDAQKAPTQSEQNLSQQFQSETEAQRDNWVQELVEQTDSQEMEIEIIQTYQAMQQGDVEFNVGKAQAANMVAQANNQTEAQQALNLAKDAALVSEDATVEDVQQYAQENSTELQVVDKLVSDVENIDSAEMDDSHAAQVEMLKKNAGIEYNEDAIPDDPMSLGEFVDNTDIGVSKRAVNNISNTNISNMSSDQLSDLHRTALQLQHHAENAGKINHILDESQTVEDTKSEFLSRATRIGQDIQQIWDAVKSFNKDQMKTRWDSFRGSVKNFYNASQNPVQFGSRLFNGHDDFGPFTKLFWKPANQARKIATELQDAAKNDATEFFSDIDTHAFLTETEDINSTLSGDNALTHNEKVGIYLASQDPQGRIGLIHGNGLTEQDIQDVRDAMTEQELEVADFIRTHMDSFYHLSNQTHLQTEGTYHGYLENRWPLYHDFHQEDHATNLEQEQGARQLHKLIAKEGFTKGRTADSVHEVEIDAMKVYYQMAQNVANYVAWKPVTKDWNKIWDDQMKQSVAEIYSESEANTFENWMKDTTHNQKIRDWDITERAMQKLQKGAAMSYVSYRAASMMRQTLSSVLAMAESPTQANYIKNAIGEVVVNSEEVANFVYERSSHLKERFAYKTLKKANEGRSLENIIDDKEGLRNKGTRGLRAMDRKTVLAVWKGAYDMAMEGEVSGLEATEENAITYADLLVAKTQPSSDAMDRSQILRSDGASRWLTIFQNAASKFPNYVNHDIIMKTAKGHRSVGDALWGLGLAQLASGFLLGLSRRGRLPRNWKEAAVDQASIYLGGIPAFGNMLTGALRGFRNISLVAFAPLQNLSDAAQSIRDGDIKRGMQATAETLGMLGQMPVSQAKILASGLIDLYNGDATDLRRLIWSEWSFDAEEERGNIQNMIDTGKINSPDIDSVELE